MQTPTVLSRLLVPARREKGGRNRLVKKGAIKMDSHYV